jgi:hypothetical protein
VFEIRPPETLQKPLLGITAFKKIFKNVKKASEKLNFSLAYF